MAWPHTLAELLGLGVAGLLGCALDQQHGAGAVQGGGLAGQARQKFLHWPGRFLWAVRGQEFTQLVQRPARSSATRTVSRSRRQVRSPSRSAQVSRSRASAGAGGASTAFTNRLGGRGSLGLHRAVMVSQAQSAIEPRLAVVCGNYLA